MINARELSVPEIVEAVLHNEQIIVQTEYGTEFGRQVWLEYPANTINVNDDVPYYQVDTGPMDCFQLAVNDHLFDDRDTGPRARQTPLPRVRTDGHLMITRHVE